jgi:hypothetical protein
MKEQILFGECKMNINPFGAYPICSRGLFKTPLEFCRQPFIVATNDEMLFCFGLVGTWPMLPISWPINWGQSPMGLPFMSSSSGITMPV